MLPKRLAALLATASLMGASPAFAEVPNVVASIKPVHSLVASVMRGVGDPALLLSTNASPHTYTMRPSEAAMLSSADLVFWVGPGIESFLTRSLDSLAGGATVVELSEVDGLTLLPHREGGLFEPHVHEDGDGHEHAGHSHDHVHEGHDHGDDGMDQHVWLDPANAAIMVDAIADALETRDPQNAIAYRDNAETEKERLAALAEEVRALSEPVQGRTFITFHDAFQYFENAFGVSAVGSVMINPEVTPGARRVSELQARIEETGTRCLVAEPQFPRQIVDLLKTDETKIAVLDPEGGSMEAGPDLYAALIRQNAEALAQCLAD